MWLARVTEIQERVSLVISPSFSRTLIGHCGLPSYSRGGRGHYIHTPVHPNIYLTLGEREGEGERERVHLEVAKKEGLLPVCKSGSL